MKRKYFGISLAGLLLLSACGQAAPVPSSSPEAAVSVPSNAAAVATATPAPAASSLPLAAEVFDWVTWVEEWQPGQYLVSGFDIENTPVCGIVDNAGRVQLLEGYASAYALADGNMIASKQVVNTRIDATDEVRPILGDIVDTEGNILYETDDAQRLYILTPETVFAVRASTNFEGDVVEYGVLNQNGEWIHEWTQTDVIPVKIEEEQISFDEVHAHFVRGITREDPVLFIIGNTLYYWTEVQDIPWKDIDDVIPQELQNWQYYMQPRIYDHALLLEHNVVYQSDGSYHPIYEELLIGDPNTLTITPEMQAAIDENRYGSALQINYLGTVLHEGQQTPVFRADNVFYDRPLGPGMNTVLDAKTMYLLGEDGGEIPFSEEYASALRNLWVSRDQLVALLENSEGDSYVAVFAPDGTVLTEPYPLGAMRIVGVESGRLLLISDTYEAAVWDAATGAELFHATADGRNLEYNDLTLLSDDMVLARFHGYDEEDMTEYTYALYTMSGSRIV